MKIMKKGLAILLATVMLFTVIPMGSLSAFAATDDTDGTLVLNQPYTVTLDGNGTAMLSFTPEASGWYKFYSTRDVGGNADPQAWLYDSNEVQLEYDDDNEGSWNFRITYNLVAGETYLLEVDARNSTESFDVYVEEVEPKTITSVQFEDLTVIEGDCYMDSDWNDETGEWDPEYSKYRYSIVYTITYSDGSTSRQGGNDIYDDCGEYWINITDDQSWQTPWGEGPHTVTATIEELGISQTFTVTVKGCPIKSVVVDKLQIIEGYNVYSTSDDIYDEETGEYIGQTPKYDSYDVPAPPDANCTITLTDGTVFYDNGIDWEDNWYVINIVDTHQSYENQWVAGNTYEVDAEIAGYEFTFEVEVIDTPVKSVEIPTMVLYEKLNAELVTDKYYNEETGEYTYSPEYLRYVWRPAHEKFTITLFDGTVINDDGFDWNNDYHYVRAKNPQSYENQWTAGNTYEVKAEIAGYEFTYKVEILSCPVVSVEIPTISRLENVKGEYTTDEYYNEETGEYTYSPEYFRYNSLFPKRQDVVITLFDGTVINDNRVEWNGITFTLQISGTGQSYENQWTAGNTYEVNGYIAGFEFTYNVEIVKSPVVSVEIPTRYIIENTNGNYTCDWFWDEELWQEVSTPEYFQYHTPWPSQEDITITLSDGQVINGDSIRWDGEYYDISLDTEQSYENQWTVGNTYEVKGEIAGFKFTYNVEIIKCPVASVKIPTIYQIENVGGYYTTDEYYNEETGEYTYSPEYFRYETPWPNYEDVTITLSDGTVINGTNFELNGENYGINIWSDQSYENQWTTGNTYEVKGEIAGFEFTYNVEIIKNPVVSIEIPTIQILENTQGYYTTDEYWDEETGEYTYSPEYFQYHTPWPNDEDVTITLSDGRVIHGTGFEWNGQYYSMGTDGTDQSYENQWTAGNTYEISAQIAGYEFTYKAEIIKTPVASVVIDPISKQENTGGYYTKDEYYNEETGEYTYSPEYFRYHVWPNSNQVTITLADGTVINDNWFEWNGRYFYMQISEIQSYENQWTAGNTYEVSGSIAGFDFTYEIDIVQLSQNDSFEYIAGGDGVIITDSFITPETLEIPAEIDGKPVIGVTHLRESDEVHHIIFPDSVKTIGDYLIENFSCLETVTFGSGIRNLNPEMFWYSQNLKEIVVSQDNPNFCTEDGVLYNKSKTTVIAFPIASGNTYNVPNSVTDIDALSAAIYSNLEITFSDGHAYFVTEDGVTYNKDKTKIIFCSKNKEGSYVMPETVTEIASGAFSGCTKLTEVIVSPQVTELVYCVFFSCLSLESIDLPDGLVSIGESAFEGASALEDVDLPDSLEDIGCSAFRSSGLTSLTLPDSVQIVESGAFKNTKISNLNLGNGVVEIYSSAFANTPVTAVTLPDSLAYLGDSAFSSCRYLEQVTFGSGLEYISAYTFAHTGIKNLNIPSNIREIYEFAFYGSALETLTLSEGLEYIGPAAFASCGKLTAVTIPNSVYDISTSAFAHCASLSTVKLGDGLECLGAYAFANCPITNLDLGNSIAIISPEAFKNTDMTQQFLPSSVTDIMYGAFMDCENLTSIEIPITVETIEYDTFAGCENLTDVYYQGTEADRDNMNIDPQGNEYLLNAVWHYGWTNDNWEDAPVVPGACTHENVTVFEEQPSTCTQQGHRAYTFCNDCEKVIKGSNALLPLVEHIYNQEVTTDTYKKSDATCTTAAEYYYSCSCGDKGTETFTVGTALGHTHNQQVTNDKYLKSAADCENAAVYYYSCSCGDKGTETFTFGTALGHTYNQQVTNDKYLKSAANCENAAVYYYSCSCGDKGTKTFTVGTALGHTHNQQVTNDKYLKSAADCENAAVYYYSCSCGDKGTETFTVGTALGHTYNQQVTNAKYLKSAADCENAAVYYYSCSCGDKGTKTFTVGTALGHTYNQQVTNAKYLKSAADCKNAAVYYYSCSCGNKGTKTFTVGTALGHKHDNACDTQCNVCKKTRTVAGHKYDSNADTTCNYCGAVAYPGGNTLVNEGGVWYHVVNRAKVADTTLVQHGGVWYYVKDGKVDFSATTLVSYNNKMWYVKAGKMNRDNTLVQYGGVWYHVNGGNTVTDTTLVQYSGVWYYVKDGKVDFSATTLVSYNNKMWYVKAGKMNRDNTLVQYGGVWYHVNGGNTVTDTTLVQYGGVWYYVKDGKVDFSATTLVSYNNKMWYVKAGKMNRDNTLVKYGGEWYHVNGGNTVTDTTLVQYSGAWYYVKDGKVDFKSNTLVKYNNEWYHVNGGKWVKDTTLVKYGNVWYYVSGGKVDFNYTGSVKYNGKTYKVVKGKLA